MGSAVSTEDLPDTRPLEPLGPKALSWKYFALWAGFTAGSVPQLYQLMHPVLGHAVDEHSNFLDDPFDRLIRSMGPIYGVIYDGPDAPATAAAVRSYHEHIKGTMPDGSRYSGLNPEVFFWAHATFVDGLIYGFSKILGPFSRAEQERMYGESLCWYRQYGVSMRDVPRTLDEFDAYWAHYLADVLEPTHAALGLLEVFRNFPVPPALEWLPEPVWGRISPVVGYYAVVFATGFFPPLVRARLDLAWGRRQRLEYAALLRGVRTWVRLTPRQHRYHPRAAKAWRREAALRGVRVRDLIPAIRVG